MLIVKCYLFMLGTLPTATWALIPWDDLLSVGSPCVFQNVGTFSNWSLGTSTMST